MAAVSTGASASTSAATDFGWRRLLGKSGQHIRDEERICESLDWEGARTFETGGRYDSHDLEVSLGIDHVPPGFYEVKRLHVRNGKYVDRRFKVGQRGERIYGRRDAEIKSFATALEDWLDTAWCPGTTHEPGPHWGVSAVTDLHEFIDQALLRRHGKKFHERLLRLARASTEIPSLLIPSKNVIDGGVRQKDIQAGLGSLSGIFIIADHIYTLVKPSEYRSFIGFDSASAEGPKLTYQGAVPLDKFGRKKG